MHVRDLSGVRVVASPEALDRVVAGASEALVFRFAPDEAFIADRSGADRSGSDGVIQVDDPDAIVVTDPGFFAVELSAAEFAAVVLPHVEWPVPPGPEFVQGAVANVPTKILIDAAGDAVVLVAKAYERDFRERVEVDA